MNNKQKKDNIKKYILETCNKINEKYSNLITEDRINLAIKLYTSSQYINYPESQIKDDINKDIKEMLVLRKENEHENYIAYKNTKYKELLELYKKTKEKYGNMQYEINEIKAIEHMQSFNETKEVQLVGPNKETKYGFYKGEGSPNEYELLVSRLGKIVGVPVADYFLDFNKGSINGVSISCIPDKDKVNFISGYDFVKKFKEVSSVVERIKANPNEPKPKLTYDQTQYYIDLLIKGFKDIVKDSTQLEKLKKDYFESVLFNLILDQKDYNYSNFAVLYDKDNNLYSMSPLFDNGGVKENSSLEGTMITTLGRSSKKDILDLLYIEYYDYISDFSKRLESEEQKRINDEENIISDIYSCINDTLCNSEARKYQETVKNTLSLVLEREKFKKNIQDVYYPCPWGDISKNVKGKVFIIAPNPEKGFNCGYSLFIPEGCQLDTTLLVHACNTGGKGVKNGKVRDKDNKRVALHLNEGNEAARLSTIELNSGMIRGSSLKMPVLIPLIPRINGYYTQALGSKVFENDISGLIEINNEHSIEKKLSEEELKRIQEQCKDLPEQLTCMIKNSKNVISNLGINIDEKVIIEGYSAGSKFANCYTALHPEMVKACISGGTSGLGILPISELKGEKLNYPLGVNNVPNFNAEKFKSIPQYYYIGDNDYNDPAEILTEKTINADGIEELKPLLDNQGNVQSRYKENYTQHELSQIHNLLGKNPQERFINNKKMYMDLGVNAQFEVFKGDHNSVTQEKNDKGEYVVDESINGFIKSVLKKDNKEEKETQKEKGFDYRTQSEINIANQIKEKNMVIKKENQQNNSVNKQKTKTLKMQPNNNSSSDGFVFNLILTLITGYGLGTILTIIYYIFK